MEKLLRSEKLLQEQLSEMTEFDDYLLVSIEQRAYLNGSEKLLNLYHNLDRLGKLEDGMLLKATDYFMGLLYVAKVTINEERKGYNQFQVYCQNFMTSSYMNKYQ